MSHFNPCIAHSYVFLVFVYWDFVEPSLPRYIHFVGGGNRDLRIIVKQNTPLSSFYPATSVVLVAFE